MDTALTAPWVGWFQAFPASPFSGSVGFGQRPCDGLFPDLTAARLVIWRVGYDVTTIPL